MTEDRSLEKFLEYLDEMEGLYRHPSQYLGNGPRMSTPEGNGPVGLGANDVYLTIDQYVSPERPPQMQTGYQPFPNRVPPEREGGYNSRGH